MRNNLCIHFVQGLLVYTIALFLGPSPFCHVMHNKRSIILPFAVISANVVVLQKLTTFSDSHIHCCFSNTKVVLGLSVAKMFLTNNSIQNQKLQSIQNSTTTGTCEICENGIGDETQFLNFCHHLVNIELESCCAF